MNFDTLHLAVMCLGTVTKSRILGWEGHVTRMEECRNIFKILTGKPTRKRPLERPRSN